MLVSVQDVPPAVLQGEAALQGQPGRQVTILRGTPAELLAQIKAARAADLAGDAERKRLAGKMVGYWAGGGVLFVLAFITVILLPPLGVLLFIGLAVLIMFGMKLGKAKGRLDAEDLDDPRLKLVEELLSTLGPDISDKRPLMMRLAHGATVKFGTKTQESSQGNWMTGKVNLSEHEDRWLLLSGRLQDGSVFRISSTEELKRKSKPKRKYTKVTDRFREKVSLSIRVSATMYPHLDRLRGILQPQRLAGQAGLQVRAFQVEGNAVRITATTGLYIHQQLRYGAPQSGIENRLAAHKLIGLLAFIYAGLSHCRASAPAPLEVSSGAAPAPQAPGAPPAYVPPA